MRKIIVKTWRYDSFSSIWIKNSDVVVNNWSESDAVVKEAKQNGFKVKVSYPKESVFKGAK